MTAITHPLVSTHHVITVLLTAAVSVGLTVALMLAFTTTTTATAVGHLTHADPVLCDQLANATPGSPPAFRLADTIASSGQTC
jgi:hypothetical protein